MRTMADSITVADLPTNCDLYLGYVDGKYANVAAVRKRFPRKRVLTVTVLGSLDADIADVERGDLTPESGAQWAKAKLARGEHPTLYFIQSTEPAIRKALKAAGVDVRKVSLFAANYDGKAVVPAGYVAKQYANPDVHRKGHFDLSVVAPYWPGIDTPPAPKPAGFSIGTAAAIGVVTRQLRRRTRPLDAGAKARLADLSAQIKHATGLK